MAITPVGSQIAGLLSLGAGITHRASRFLVSCYAHMGRIDEARELIARFGIAPAPGFAGRAPGTPFRDPEQRGLLLSGLRLAMSQTT